MFESTAKFDSSLTKRLSERLHRCLRVLLNLILLLHEVIVQATHMRFESTAKFDSSLTFEIKTRVVWVFESTAKFDSSLTDLQPVFSAS